MAVVAWFGDYRAKRNRYEKFLILSGRHDILLTLILSEAIDSH